jgi:hypothetical protein
VANAMMEANKNLHNLKNDNWRCHQKQTIIIGYQVSPLQSLSDYVKMRITMWRDIKRSNKS